MFKRILVCLLLATIIIGCSSQEHETKHLEAKPYLVLLHKKTPAVALKQLAIDIDVNKQLVNSCHMIVHQLGHAAYEKYGFNNAMQYADDICGSGYMHGVTEKYISGIDNPLSKLNSVCPKGYGACFHGVGHGLFIHYQADLVASLAGCSSFVDSTEKIQCSEGVFMENFYTDLNSHVNHNLDPKNPLAICSNQDTIYKSACYFYGPRYLLTINHRNYKQALDLCSTVESSYRSQCARGVGSALMRQNLDNLPYTFATCNTAQPNLQTHCYSGLASYYTIHKGSYEEAITLCSEVPEQFVNTCNATIDSSRNFFED